MTISAGTVLGLLSGVVVGVISMGRVGSFFSPQIVRMVHDYAWWIVVLSMLVPLADYLSEMRTTFVGVVTGHPFRHLAGFFAGFAVALGLFLLLAPRLP